MVADIILTDAPEKRKVLIVLHEVITGQSLYLCCISGIGSL